jgi:molybdopterin/thiamine biosynthesis adenylyltransferase
VGSLREKTALVLGAGGLGGPAALALAQAGLGRLLLEDSQPVTPTDLALFPLLSEEALGAPRGDATARALSRLFPALEVQAPTRPIAPDLLLARARAAQVLVDASDRFRDMFLASDAAVAAGIPLVHGGLLHHTLQLLTVLPGATGCLRCLFEAPPPTPADPPQAAALGPLAGLAGSLLGVEAVRLLQGQPGAYTGLLLTYQARTGWSRAVPAQRRPDCAACGYRAAGAAHAPLPAPRVGHPSPAEAT